MSPSPARTPTGYPTLSARELAAWVAAWRHAVIGARVERVFVPSCPSHPDGYFKKEWAWELHHPGRGGAQFYFNVRPQECGFLVLPPKTLKPAAGATRSGFDLSLAKSIEGRRVADLILIENERAVLARFNPVGDEATDLYLILIPSQPEAVLVVNGERAAGTRVRDSFEPPPPRRLSDEELAKIPLRPDRIEPADAVVRRWMELRDAQALELRRRKLRSQLELEREAIHRKAKSLEEQLEQTQAEPDWNRYGSLLQTHFHAQPAIEKRADGKAVYLVQDYENDTTVELPADPKLGLKQQLERYFHLAKRRRARLQETQARIEGLRAKLPTLEKKLEALERARNLAELQALAPETKAAPVATKAADQKKLAEFSGRTYLSKEGLTILSGRNAKENLDLTFKIARGNDLWLHVKGRPGSHTVILLPPKKSASLETLLDAAHLCILYSGGKDWGKTEVDYTQRKYVKKIKNHTEVSYTNNKTLAVTLDPARVQRLKDGE